MKKNIYKIITSILIITLIISNFSFVLSATEKYNVINQGIITIATVSGNTGDTVIVPITIAENPGIAGISISITYNSSDLEFIEDMVGDVIYEYQTKAHPSKNLIRLVTAERFNRTNNGTLINLKFKINSKTKAGLSKISITYNKGDFCNYKLDRIMPKIISGGVEVGLSKDNCPHSNYSKWSIAAISTCTENGSEKRECKDCGHIELRDIEPIGHEYSKEFTIDKVATKEESGLMSRHCIRCSDFTDQISYTLTDAEKGDIDNEYGNIQSSNKYIENLVSEQAEAPDSNDNSSQSKPDNEVSQTTESEPENNSQENIEETKPENKDDKTDNKSEAEKEEITAADKIREAFPNADNLLKIFKIAGLILLILVLL